MGFPFLKKNTTSNPRGAAAHTVTLPLGGQAPDVARTGKIDLAKGEGISLKKTPRIVARCTWPTKTDYDVLALVAYADGRVEHVATFGTQDGPRASAATADGAVRHLGDVRRGDGQVGSETIEIALNDRIAAIIPVVYSAQSNGTGSFRQYQVSMEIDNGEDSVVSVDARNALDDPNVYSCVPGVILNGKNGVRVEAVELYSARNSESRPGVQMAADSLTVTMDQGPVNVYK